MRLLLVRHADAVDRLQVGLESDFHRRLSEHGQQQALGLAQILHRRGIYPGAILTSPLVRAVETTEALAQTLTPGKEFLVTEWLALEGLRPKKLSRLIVQQAANPVILVGHMPDLGDYASWLLDAKDGAVVFEKAAVACIECPHVISKGGGSLEWLITPEWYI